MIWLDSTKDLRGCYLLAVRRYQLGGGQNDKQYGRLQIACRDLIALSMDIGCMVARTITRLVSRLADRCQELGATSPFDNASKYLRSRYVFGYNSPY